MKASENSVVTIVYELRKSDEKGEVVEALDYNRPLTFIMGRGNLLPKFEDQLAGMKAGEAFTISLSCEDAYGSVEESAVIEVPSKIFEVDGKIDTNLLQLGNIVPMMDREGRRLNGLIQKIEQESVTMDFNHPLAGENLFFKGEVTNVREASGEELEHGHIHATGGCSGCSDGGCESDCQSDCQSEGSSGGCGCS